LLLSLLLLIERLSLVMLASPLLLLLLPAIL
jgi:hypothetical protein